MRYKLPGPTLNVRRWYFCLKIYIFLPLPFLISFFFFLFLRFSVYIYFLRFPFYTSVTYLALNSTSFCRQRSEPSTGRVVDSKAGPNIRFLYLLWHFNMMWKRGASLFKPQIFTSATIYSSGRNKRMSAQLQIFYDGKELCSSWLSEKRSGTECQSYSGTLPAFREFFDRISPTGNDVVDLEKGNWHTLSGYWLDYNYKSRVQDSGIVCIWFFSLLSSRSFLVPRVFE